MPFRIPRSQLPRLAALFLPALAVPVWLAAASSFALAQDQPSTASAAPLFRAFAVEDAPSSASSQARAERIRLPSGWGGIAAFPSSAEYSGWSSSELITRFQERLDRLEALLRKRSWSEAKRETGALRGISAELLQRAVDARPPMHTHGLFQLLRLEALSEALAEFCDDDWPAHARSCHRQAKRLARQLTPSLPESFLRVR